MVRWRSKKWTKFLNKPLSLNNIAKSTFGTGCELFLIYCLIVSVKGGIKTRNDSWESMFSWIIPEGNFISTNVNIHGHPGLKRGGAAAATEQNTPLCWNLTVSRLFSSFDRLLLFHETRMSGWTRKNASVTHGTHTDHELIK